MENINLLIIYVVVGVVMGQALLTFISTYLMFFPIRGRQFLSIIYLVFAAIAFYMDIWVVTSFLLLTSIITLATAILTEKKLESQQILLQEYIEQQNKEKLNESGRTSGDVEQGVDEQETEVDEGDNSSA